MRIQSIEASNLLKHAELTIPDIGHARVVLVAGPNGAGKTSVVQGIRLALTGKPQRGIPTKNRLKELIKQGASDGQVRVSTDAGHYKLNLKTGNYTGSCPPDFGHGALCLDPLAFFHLDAATRKRVLFDVSGVSLKPANVADDLKAEGFDQDRIDAIREHFRLGFDGMSKRAKELASEARGAWQALTGETYGSNKAQDWAPLLPEDQGHDLDQLTADVDKAVKVEAGLKATLESLRSDARATEGLEKHTALAARVPELTASIARQRQTAEGEEVAWEKAKAAASGAGGWTAPCPCCGVVLRANKPGSLIEDDGGKPPAELMAAVDAAKARLDAARTDLTALERQLAAAQASKDMLANMPTPPDANALQDAMEDHQQAERDVRNNRALLASATEAAQQRASATERANRARAYHADVEAYTRLADAILALPVRYLSKSIETINGHLTGLRDTLDAPIVLGKDMELYYGTVPYALCSKSEQWRLEFAMAVILCKLTDFGLVVIDEFDVIEPQSRGKILGYMAGQAHIQFVVAATLKEKPGALPDAFALKWLNRE